MNQLKELGGLSKMLSSSLEASKMEQEKNQEEVKALLSGILDELKEIHCTLSNLHVACYYVD